MNKIWIKLPRLSFIQTGHWCHKELKMTMLSNKISSFLQSPKPGEVGKPKNRNLTGTFRFKPQRDKDGLIEREVRETKNYLPLLSRILYFNVDVLHMFVDPRCRLKIGSEMDG